MRPLFGWLKRNKKVQPGNFVSKRANIVYATLAICFILLGARAIVIQLFPSSSQSLNRIADKQYNRVLNLARYRGSIYDRRREPLAISIRRPSIFINPRVFQPTKKDLTEISRILNMKESTLQKIVSRKTYFAWLKRKASKDAAQKIETLNLNGLYQVMEPARYYPAGVAAANLLGYVGLDDVGLSGIERQLEKPLAGSPIKVFQSKDAKGNTIFLQSHEAAPEQTGDNIYLTIDRAVQEIAEDALRKGVHTANAQGGFAIVSDPHTGQILALANYPTFDPNNAAHINVNLTKNRALMDAFEPGSVLKPFVVATAMSLGKTNENESFDCEGGVLKVGNRTIRDAHPPETQFLTTTEIIVHSSNVCTYKIARRIGMAETYDGLRNFGFSERLSLLGFPGETAGYLEDWHSWLPIRFANVAFGQGIMVSGLEIVQAYGAIANGGNLMKAYVIDRIESSTGEVKQNNSATLVRRVMTPNLAKRMRGILSKVVDDAATKAQINGYTAGGKTGTTQKIDPITKSYSHSKHLASFAGFTPSNDPHLVIYVQIDEPVANQHYGALWAAPVFTEIAERTLNYLNVEKDKPLSISKSLNHEKNPAITL